MNRRKCTVLLESTITTFLAFSGSSNFEKWPGPEPRSRIVSNLRLISYHPNFKTPSRLSLIANLPLAFPSSYRRPHFEHNPLSDFLNRYHVLQHDPFGRVLLPYQILGMVRPYLGLELERKRIWQQKYEIEKQDSDLHGR
jgi:hypothetical protein